MNCECGCGQLAPLAKQTLTRLGHIKGQPVRFINGHQWTAASPRPRATADAPWYIPNTNAGMCMCGCSEAAPLAMQSSRRNGHIQGQPMRFIVGHNNRGRTMPPVSAETREKIGAATRGVPRPQQRGPLHGRHVGRKVWEAGYVEVYVGHDHPMAGRHGYCLEHRLVMSEMIGRPLLSEEQVHHVNTDPGDNRRENLWLFPDGASHTEWHYMVASGREMEYDMGAVRLHAYGPNAA